jgi:uncharacterized membrane protein YoaK (UPF0700 family)
MLHGSSNPKRKPFATRQVEDPLRASIDAPSRTISETRIRIAVPPRVEVPALVAVPASVAVARAAPVALPQKQAQPESQTQMSDIVGSSILSAVAGYVDTAGFLALYGMFTAHITGDLVIGGALVADPGQDGIVVRLAMVPIFMSSVTIATLIARRVRRRGHAPLALLLLLMSAALSLFCLTGVTLRPLIHGPNNWALAITASTGVGAMAIQNTLMRDSLRRWTPTTIMTGNLTQVTIQLVELAFPIMFDDPERRALARKQTRADLLKYGLPLLGFVAGVALSAYLTHRFAFWSLALPAAGVGILGAQQWRRARDEMAPG